MHPAISFPYLLHRLKARSRFDVHSPFVYTLHSKVLRDHKEYPEYIQLENLCPCINGKKYYRLLFRLSAWLKPPVICFSGKEECPEKVYLHSGHPEGRIISCENKPEEMFDLIFIDLQFITEPIIMCFSPLLQHISNESVFIIWSVNDPGKLSENWKSFQDFQGVTATIDLFRLGLVFFNQDLSRENFKLHF